MRAGKRCLKTGVGSSLVESGGTELIHQLSGLIRLKQGARQLGHNDAFWMLGRKGLAQLNFRAAGIPVLQKETAKQESRFGHVRIFLQHVLQLNQR